MFLSDWKVSSGPLQGNDYSQTGVRSCHLIRSLEQDVEGRIGNDGKLITAVSNEIKLTSYVQILGKKISIIWADFYGLGLQFGKKL